MKAVHLYHYPSTYANVADRIEIKKEARESLPGDALHAELELPEGWQAVSTDFGDAIVTDADEIVEKVYPGKLEIAGNAYRGPVTIYSETGKVLLHCNVNWN